MKVSVYLPCRAGSYRIKHKNTRRFFKQDSLLSLKLNTLLTCSNVGEICVSTNDLVVMEQAEKICDNRIKIFKRSEELCSSYTKTDDLVQDMQRICSGEVLLWTHVTSPFLTSELYSEMLAKFTSLKSHDSDDGNKTSDFLWYQDKPLNYDRSLVKWPNTQTLEIAWEINSGFIVSRETSVKYGDRIEKEAIFLKPNFLVTLISIGSSILT